MKTANGIEHYFDEAAREVVIHVPGRWKPLRVPMRELQDRTRPPLITEIVAQDAKDRVARATIKDGRHEALNFGPKR